MADDTNTAERDAFEKWIEQAGGPHIKQATNEGNPLAKQLMDAWWAAWQARASLAASAIETKRYADGTTATGIGPLPKHSPSVQHALRVLTDVESMLGGANGPTIQIRAVLESLAASAGSEPVASDGWLHQDGLLYRLTDERRPCNRDDINVTMADGSRSIESRSRRALELLDRIRATHPSPPEGMAGWKLVPIEPTLDMGWAYLDAARESEPLRTHSFNHAGYRAMIAAAPPLPASEEKEL